MSTTVSRVLRAHVAERPDAEFLVCDDDRLTYTAAERRSRVLARGLLAVATARIGAIAVPISTFSTSRELRDLFVRADVDLVLGVREYRGNDYAVAIDDAVGPLVGGERPVASPHLRGVWLDGLAALEARAAEVPDALLDAIE